MLTTEEKKQIEEQGMNLQTVEEQLSFFKSGFPYMEITAPATIGNGIFSYTEDKIASLLKTYDAKSQGLDIVKFVPASGAASRMFKKLFELADGTDTTTKDNVQFIEELSKFAFYDELNTFFEQKYDINLTTAVSKGKVSEIATAVLSEDGLGYGSLPKGLLSFHSYKDGSRTPLEEHLVEGATYAKGNGGKVKIHFTVSPEHMDKFKALVNKIKATYETKLGVSIEIDYSIQQADTDTIAVDPSNKPFYEGEKILFRPGGHGALLANLNSITADLVFIKNIDNVVPDSLKEDTIKYKKVLAGALLVFQEKIFGYLKALENGSTDTLIAEVSAFLKEEVGVAFPQGFESSSLQEKASYLHSKLNKPVRACGMVKNEGEPGGGPFWCKENDGSISLQVVESAQIDPEDAEKAKIVTAATHFNPVDLVCATKNHKGEKFDLMKFRDAQTGFISEKSKGGKSLKAQELPGLWNGSMADWNTIFVEVPVTTFNPVKTVNDLLRPSHQ